MRSWGGILKGLKNLSRIENPQLILSRLQISTGGKYTSSIEALGIEEPGVIWTVGRYTSRQVASIHPLSRH